ncbi:helix-turn-helix domain-containing protein [Streptomyces sp. SCL15-4]|uniref:helix-turn-helix domain-containing protein n=1 Tax=Streptomyces sp. SCL15-4 TaxID=2967221 RepID=UPI0029676720|nr:helix-turn-helix domain-containing protein [Streptomyces sp. SCL15-4]
MKVRADIAALIREGHTNAYIARRLYCDPSTVARARHALRLPPADKLGRIYAEATPTRPAPPPPGSHWTPQQQDAHWTALCHAVGTPGAPRPTDTENARQAAA